MVAILTGSLTGNQIQDQDRQMRLLTNYLETFGATPLSWEVYRGKEFQLRINSPQRALSVAINLKSLLKSLPGVDIRMGIGLGEESYRHSHISRSNGTAYLHSIAAYESTSARHKKLCLKSEQTEFDQSINLMLRLALSFMNHWTPTSAATLSYVLDKPGVSQEEISRQLGVSQSTISQRLTRAHYQPVCELIHYFEKKVAADLANANS